MATWYSSCDYRDLYVDYLQRTKHRETIRGAGYFSELKGDIAGIFTYSLLQPSYVIRIGTRRLGRVPLPLLLCTIDIPNRGALLGRCPPGLVPV